jgi:hypothetical protein
LSWLCEELFQIDASLAPRVAQQAVNRQQIKAEVIVAPRGKVLLICFGGLNDGHVQGVSLGDKSTAGGECGAAGHASSRRFDRGGLTTT